MMRREGGLLAESEGVPGLRFGAYLYSMQTSCQTNKHD